MCAALVATAGCGDNDGPVPVSGVVKYDDGSPTIGEVATVTFEPVGAGEGVKGASGAIGEDGAFELMTYRHGDGALPGDYRVTVHLRDAYPKGKSLVAPEFSDARKTPLTATIPQGGKTDFEFIVKKP